MDGGVRNRRGEVTHPIGAGRWGLSGKGLGSGAVASVVDAGVPGMGGCTWLPSIHGN